MAKKIKQISTSDEPALKGGQCLGGWSKCYTCGKVIYTGMYDMTSWVYKYCGKFCCSYSCMNKAPEVKVSAATKKKDRISKKNYLTVR